MAFVSPAHLDGRRPRPDWLGPGGPWPVQVFSVDDTSAQLVWRGSPAEDLRIEVGDNVVRPSPAPRAVIALGRPGGDRPALADLEPGSAAGSTGGSGRRLRVSTSPLGESRRELGPRRPAGPGAVVVEGLSPGRTYDVVVSARGIPAFRACRLTTLRPPPGRLLARFATVSDVHIGERQFGIWGRIHDVGEPPYPLRAWQAAVSEASDWGAELLVVKGDLTRDSTPAEVRDFAGLLAAVPMTTHPILGNHDSHRGVNVIGILDHAGTQVTLQPRAVDITGLRLVLLNTMHGDPRYHRGHVPAEQAARAAELAAAAPGPVWLAMHHPPDLHRYPTCYPPGVPFTESRLLLRALEEANPSTFVTCGHRHRNRLYRSGGLVISEVGSTKDYPGCWAGYKVYEQGLVQTVRRIARPDVMTWTEVTRRAMNGQWGRWSPGRLDDRCFALTWP